MTGSTSISKQIDSLVQSYTDSQTKKLVDPLTAKQKRYQSISDGYDTLSTKLTALKSTVANMKLTGTDSVFASKTASSSKSDFVDATVTSTASASGYAIRVNQLAKSDVAVSPDQTSATANTITGTHDFVIQGGDGKGGQFTSHVSVTFGASETNQTVMEKVRDAINQNQEVVNSTAKTGTTSYTGGPSTFTIDLNGNTTDISVTGGSTYDALMNELVTNINSNISGVTAAKIVDTPAVGDVALQLTVNDNSNYISITPKSGFDVVTDLGIGVTQEKSAAGIVTASVFSPTTTTSQLSLTATQTGLDYRIENLADTAPSSALATVGLNLGATRPTFDQTTSPDTAGYIYPDTTTAANQLNSMITFNGLDIQRNSNSISDLAPGVTFNLKGVMQATDTTVNVTVANDVKTVETKLKDFITKFNDVYTNIKNNSISSSTERGIFVGDANASTLLNVLTSISYSQIAGISTGNLSYLAQLGMTFDPMSGLSISDTSELEKKLKDTPDQVGAIFNSSSGIANTLYNTVTPYIGAGGYLSTSQSILNDNITAVKDRITQVKSNIDKEASSLRDKYVQLQVQLSQLTMSQSFFQLNTGTRSLFG